MTKWNTQALVAEPSPGAPPGSLRPHSSCAGVQTSLITTGTTTSQHTANRKQGCCQVKWGQSHKKSSMPDFHHQPQWCPARWLDMQGRIVSLSSGQNMVTICSTLSPSWSSLLATFLKFSHPTSARFFLEGLEKQCGQGWIETMWTGSFLSHFFSSLQVQPPWLLLSLPVEHALEGLYSLKGSTLITFEFQS